MGGQRLKKNICIGLLAHVDAGKTTLSEALLYTGGALRRLGRVDHQDAFLDTYELERKRGITIFSKQAVLKRDNLTITLLDTPGHVDFSAETERTLQVLDAAVLVISASDGVQGHTRTLWRLLKRYRVPVFLFVNKMDQPGTDREFLLRELSNRLDSGCVDFSDAQLEKEMEEAFFESIAMCDEGLLNAYLQNGKLSLGQIKRAIADRKVFPCYFGSALKLWGVEELLSGIAHLAGVSAYPDEFGAKVFKITRDLQGNRLTHMKITGGTLTARTLLTGKGERAWEEKVNQIRIYSGDKFEMTQEAAAGTICAVTGLTAALPGDGLGIEENSAMPLLEPVLRYRIELPEGCDAASFLPKLRELEEEDPMLGISWEEETAQIHANVMGEVQIEILKDVIKKRFGVEADFGTGAIVYKETIKNKVEGVGHFEPLRHYAEVHLLMEPGEPGSGLVFESICSEDVLAGHWQRLILTHLQAKEHRGVLTGSPITDMKLTLASGRAHLKHTEGGDFRQATYRAVRQGLMEAENVLLEPVYEFRLELPDRFVGRAMTDLDQMKAVFSMEQSAEGAAVLTGTAAVSAMQNYQKEVTAYTRGEGQLLCSLKGYAPCHNQDEAAAAIGYDPEADPANPSGSVFCAHGAGFPVPYDQVKDYMHLESCLLEQEEESEALTHMPAEKRQKDREEERWIGTEEIDAILSRSTHANSRREGHEKKAGWQKLKRTKETGESVTRVYKGAEKKEACLLVDGYNIIFAWEDLKELAKVSLDGARGKLLDLLCDYQAVKKCFLIAVFDAYRVQGHPAELLDYHNIHVVFTKEAETADQYIEKFAHENSRRYDVTVATSDGLEQIIIRGQGCRLFSARDLREELQRTREGLAENFLDQPAGEKRYLLDEASREVNEKLKEICEEA